jgi:hypothetical protein
MGTSEDPGRTGPAGALDWCLHCVGHPHRGRYRSGPAPSRPDLEAVPQQPSSRDHRGRLLPPRHRARHAPLLDALPAARPRQQVLPHLRRHLPGRRDELLKTGSRAPRMNAHCERIIRTLRSELCDHILILNASHAREILTRYQRHYNEHRPHQSRDQLPPDADQQPATAHDLDARRLLRTRIRGGLINEYLSLTCSDDFSSGTGWLKQRSIVGRGCFDYLATVAACRPAAETDEAAGAYGFTCSATVGRLAPRSDCWSRAVREFSRPHRLGIQAFKCASHRRRRAAERSGPGNHEP